MQKLNPARVLTEPRFSPRAMTTVVHPQPYGRLVPPLPFLTDVPYNIILVRRAGKKRSTAHLLRVEWGSGVQE